MGVASYLHREDGSHAYANCFPRWQKQIKTPGINYNVMHLHITILTYGSRGDVQPCLALAAALQSAGHSPLLVLPAFLRLQADGTGDTRAVPAWRHRSALSGVD